MRILIRADGDDHIGGGHVMRGLALAEHVGDACLAAISLAPGLNARASSLGVEVARPPAELDIGSSDDAAWAVRCAAELGAEWVVTDGYRFDASYQRAIRAAGLRQLVLDDYGHCDHYCAELVLNQNPSAIASLYERRDPQTRLLLGTRYVLMRREFSPASARVVPEVANHILVTMGAADPANTSATVIEAMGRVSAPELRVRVLIGPANPHTDQLRALCTDPRVELIGPTERMSDLMAWADLAISAAGSTTYELCCMGVPVLLVVLAENQLAVSGATVGAGAAVDLGWHHSLDADELARTIADLRGDRDARAALIRRGRELIDGNGCARVAAAMEEH